MCVDRDNEMLPIGVGSSVSTFLKTVVCVASVSPLTLLAPEVKGSSEKYRMMRTDEDLYALLKKCSHSSPRMITADECAGTVFSSARR